MHALRIIGANAVFGLILFVSSTVSAQIFVNSYWGDDMDQVLSQEDFRLEYGVTEDLIVLENPSTRIIDIPCDVKWLLPNSLRNTLQGVVINVTAKVSNREQLSNYYALRGLLSEAFGEGKDLSEWYDDLLRDNVEHAMASGSLEYSHLWVLNDGSSIMLKMIGKGIPLDRSFSSYEFTISHFSKAYVSELVHAN